MAPVSRDDFEQAISGILSQSLSLGDMDDQDRAAVQFLIGGLRSVADELLRIEVGTAELSDNPGLPSFYQARLQGLIGQLSATLEAVSAMLRIQGVASKVTINLLRHAYEAFAGLLLSSLEDMKPKLNIRSWSIGLSAGFPSGISSQLMITFEPSPRRGP